MAKLSPQCGCVPAHSFYHVTPADHVLYPEIVLGAPIDGKARVVIINERKFHSALQMVSFSMCSHLDVSVMSIAW